MRTAEETAAGVAECEDGGFLPTNAARQPAAAGRVRRTLGLREWRESRASCAMSQVCVCLRDFCSEGTAAPPSLSRAGTTSATSAWGMRGKGETARAFASAGPHHVQPQPGTSSEHHHA